MYSCSMNNALTTFPPISFVAVLLLPPLLHSLFLLQLRTFNLDTAAEES